MQKIINLGLDDQVAVLVKASHFLSDRLSRGGDVYPVRGVYGVDPGHICMSPTIHQHSTVSPGIIGPFPPRRGGY